LSGGYVLDASVTLAWCFAEEATPDTWAIFDRLQNERAVVPGNWPFEVVNVLSMAQRTGRIAEADVDEFLGVLGRAPVDVEATTLGRAAREIRELVVAERLTAYDAAYLELAMRLRLPLATKDAQLRRAAARRGVSVIPDPQGPKGG
jgi:predicted nucleic acid-binding protein